MINVTELSTLLVVAVIGHIMALFWYYAKVKNFKICKRTIYEIPVNSSQIKQEIKNSFLIPVHAVLLGFLLALDFFKNTSMASFFSTLLLTILWAEIWHYFSHRAMHHRSLHWIHLEHHKSRINTPFTALSFSFMEKLIFGFGMLLPLMVIDSFASLNFFGVAAWFIAYLVVNSFSHANFEFRPPNYNQHVGQYLTTTTYHALHHSRYTGNYGLGTRFLDKFFKTEWEDYERVYQHINSDQKPLERLRDKVSG